MASLRMLTILVEVDSKKLGGNMLLLPFEETWLAANTCRELLLQVLVQQLDRPTAVVTAEQVKMFCSKHEVVTESGLAARLEKEVANATGCIDIPLLSVITTLSTLAFTCKITTRPTAAPTRLIINPFDRMLKIQTAYISLPPCLNHVRMYANHDGYNALIDFMEENKLGWTGDNASTIGKRFVEGISKAFFECSPSTWEALNDRRNTGASRTVNCFFIIAFSCV
jgi:hypothetical protein